MPETRHDIPIDRFRLRSKEVLGIVLFWTFLAVLTATGRVLDPRLPNMRPEVSAALVSLAFIEYATWALLTFPIFWLTGRLNLGGKRRALHLFLFVVLGVVVALEVDTLLGQFRRHLMLPAARAPARGALGNILRFEFLDDLMVYFAIVGVALARNYFLRYQARLEEMQRLKAESAQLLARLASTQLAVLRTQLNPHFLFNTLHAVSSLVERDPRGVRRMIARLSELLRHTLEGSHTQEVTLEQELELLRRYLEIMEIRFQGRLEIIIDVPENLRDALVPNLLLQPLVENALEHGVSRLDTRGRVEIRGRQVAHDLILSVRDNGPGPQNAKSGGGVGLRNTVARLEQLYGSRQRFELRVAAGEGTIAEVVLPFHQKTEEGSVESDR